MSGELQTIPARHGVATFVPRGRTIKVINTYGKQVVSMWAFSLGPPPEEDDQNEDGEAEEVDEEQAQKEAEGLKKAIEEGGGAEGKDDEPEAKEEAEPSKSADKDKENEKENQETDKATEKEIEGTGKETEKESEETGRETESTAQKETEKTNDDEDPPEQAPDTPENEKASETTSKQPSKRTWASYLPSIPYRNKGAASKAEPEQKPNAQDEKAQNEANTKKWSSYLPTGKGFSSYVPNVQVPDRQDMVKAFKSTHTRDPNKSYAEQLYDFSKTPVGAGTIAAATGSGYASSAYAVYSAYASSQPSASQPPMEYLSLPHTRAHSHKLVPTVDDELLTNLRNPIVTLVEDTTPGAHDTLTAACDANQYRSLGVEKPEEHASCAVNLVLALKELNESAGLKGAKAIGSDITVNIAPTPLHLFMNAPLQLGDEAQSDGQGAKGVVIKVDEPKGKKRSFVRFRAERDVVVVFSACPMDVGKQNGGRCMAATFMVENVQEGEDLASSISSTKGKKPAPRKLNGTSNGKKSAAKPDAKTDKPTETKDEPPKEEKKEQAQRKPNPRKISSQNRTPQLKDAKKDEGKKDEAILEEGKEGEKSANAKKEEKTASAKEEEQKPKKKPKKLQVRKKPETEKSS